MISFQASAVFIYMGIIYLIAQYKRDNSIVDIAWGPGFLALICIGGFSTMRQSILAFVVIVWAGRLAYHIGSRHKGEDFRYQKMRTGWKYPRLEAFFKVFMFQALLICIIGIPLTLVNNSSLEQTLIEWIALLLCALGFTYEAYADYQLAQHKKKSKKLCTTGLWRLSRHPNYFGEIVFWWGVGVYAVRDSYLALLGPIVITLLIRYVTMPMLERKYAENKQFQKYKKTTPPIFPL